MSQATRWMRWQRARREAKRARRVLVSCVYELQKIAQLLPHEARLLADAQATLRRLERLVAGTPEATP